MECGDLQVREGPGHTRGQHRGVKGPSTRKRVIVLRAVSPQAVLCPGHTEPLLPAGTPEFDLQGNGTLFMKGCVSRLLV